MLLDRIFRSVRFSKLNGIARSDRLKLPNAFCGINFGYYLGCDFLSPSFALVIVTTFVFLFLGLSKGRNSLSLFARDFCVTLSFLLLGGGSLLLSAWRFLSSAGYPACFGRDRLALRLALCAARVVSIRQGNEPQVE